MENTLAASSNTYSLTDNLDNCVHDTCVLSKIKFSRWGALLSFICGHNLQASGHCPSNRNCVCDTTCGHNKAIIIIMEICKLPTYQNMWQTHFDIGCRDLPFQVVFGRFFFIDEKNALTFPEVGACSAMCFFVKLGLDMLSAIILATVGAWKVLFAELAKHMMFSFRGWI